MKPAGLPATALDDSISVSPTSFERRIGYRSCAAHAGQFRHRLQYAFVVVLPLDVPAVLPSGRPNGERSDIRGIEAERHLLQPREAADEQARADRQHQR